MKKLGIALSLAFMMLLAACGAQGLDVSKLEKSAYDAANQSNDIVMTLENATVAADTETLMLYLTNRSDTEYTFGMEPYLDVESDGVWYTVPTQVDAAWIEIAAILPANGDANYDLSLNAMYGNLPSGHYRVVKQLYSEAGGTFVIAEFTIE